MGFAKVAAYKEQEKPALLEQWPDLGYLGLGAWWGWIWLCYNSIDALRLFPDELRANNVFLMYLFSTIAIAVSMLAAAAAWRKATDLVDSRIIVAAFGGMASVSTFLMGLSGVAGSTAMFAAFAVLTGVGTSMLCLRAGRAYGTLPLGESLTNGALSLILAAALYYVGSGIVAEWRLAYISLLPIAAAGLFSLVGDEAYPSASIAGARAVTGKERVMFRRLVAASSIVAFTAGFGKGVSAFTVPAQFAYEGAISVFFIGLIAVVIVFAVNRYNVYQSARVVYSTLMVMGIALMLASCFGFSVTFFDHWQRGALARFFVSARVSGIPLRNVARARVRRGAGVLFSVVDRRLGRRHVRGAELWRCHGAHGLRYCAGVSRGACIGVRVSREEHQANRDMEVIVSSRVRAR